MCEQTFIYTTKGCFQIKFLSYTSVQVCDLVLSKIYITYKVISAQLDGCLHIRIFLFYVVSFSIIKAPGSWFEQTRVLGKF